MGTIETTSTRSMRMVIAGGTRGIGRAIARHFALRGWDVVLGYGQDTAAAEATRDALTAEGGRVRLVQADLATIAGCQELARNVELVDLVVHSLVQPLVGPVLEMDPAAFARAVEINGTSLLYLVQALLPRMERGGSIVYLSSRGGRMVIQNYAAIGAGKALAESLMRYLAVELAPRGIRINAVAPSIVDTAAVRALYGDATDGVLEKAARDNPSGRVVRDEDYASAVEYLASPAAEFVQGQVLAVNGGANLIG